MNSSPSIFPSLQGEEKAGLCSKVKVAIEVDGKVHDSEDRKEYDKIREEVIKMHGIRVIRFTNNEILGDFDNVLKRLFECLTENLQSSTSSSP